MKKLNIRPIILFVLLTVFLSQGYGQITVNKIEGGSVNTSVDGFIYGLPQTVFKIDLVYEKVQKLTGPLAEYSNEYLGADDYISSDKTEYNLVNVNVSALQESDPEQIYYVQYPTERSKDEKETSFSLSDIGGLLAFNTGIQSNVQNTEIITDQTFIFEEGDISFPYMSQYNKQKKIDTIVRTINIDTVTINRFLFKSSWVDKSIDDKAKEAALQIEKIRESRYNLISGYQEVNYGSSIVYMDRQMQKLENQYLQLFVGKELRTIERQTIYFVPNKDKTGGDLIRFDDGKTVAIKIITNNSSDILPDVSGSSTNRIFYRIPASAKLTISSNNKNFFVGRFLVNQLGSVSSVPLGNTKLQFDAETGNLISIIRE